MEDAQRILETQEFTQNYFKTAELLNLSYEQVREVCEDDSL